MKKRLQLPQTDSAPPALCRRSGAFRLTLTGQMPSSAHEPAPLWRKAPPSGNKTLVRLQRPARLEFELRWPDRFWEMIRIRKANGPASLRGCFGHLSALRIDRLKHPDAAPNPSVPPPFALVAAQQTRAGSGPKCPNTSPQTSYPPLPHPAARPFQQRAASSPTLAPLSNFRRACLR